jgi:hypothetical protein
MFTDKFDYFPLNLSFQFLFLQRVGSGSKFWFRITIWWYKFHLDGELGGGMERLFHSPGNLAGPGTFNICTALPATSKKE